MRRGGLALEPALLRSHVLLRDEEEGALEKTVGLLL